MHILLSLIQGEMLGKLKKKKRKEKSQQFSVGSIASLNIYSLNIYSRSDGSINLLSLSSVSCNVILILKETIYIFVV